MVTGLISREPLTVAYDADCGICTQTARALVRLDRHNLVRFVPLEMLAAPGTPPPAALREAIHAVDGSATWFTGADVFIEIARREPALLPVALFALLPGARVVLGLGYRAVAANRQLLSRALGLKACRVPYRLSAAQEPGPSSEPR